MFTSQNLIRTYLTINGIDFCVDTTIVAERNGGFWFSTEMQKLHGGEYADKLEEATSSMFDNAKRNHEKMVAKYASIFNVKPSEDDYSGVTIAFVALMEEAMRRKGDG